MRIKALDGLKGFGYAPWIAIAAVVLIIGACIFLGSDDRPEPSPLAMPTCDVAEQPPACWRDWLPGEDAKVCCNRYDGECCTAWQVDPEYARP